MQTLKTAVVVVLLLVVFYGVYEMLNRPPDAPPEEVAVFGGYAVRSAGGPVWRSGRPSAGRTRGFGPDGPAQWAMASPVPSGTRAWPLATRGFPSPIALRSEISRGHRAAQHRPASDDHAADHLPADAAANHDGGPASTWPCRHRGDPRLQRNPYVNRERSSSDRPTRPYGPRRTDRGPAYEPRDNWRRLPSRKRSITKHSPPCRCSTRART